MRVSALAPFTKTPPIVFNSPSVYTSQNCDASGEPLTFPYGNYLTSTTEVLEALFEPLARPRPRPAPHRSGSPRRSRAWPAMTIVRAAVTCRRPKTAAAHRRYPAIAAAMRAVSYSTTPGAWAGAATTRYNTSREGAVVRFQPPLAGPHGNAAPSHIYIRLSQACYYTGIPSTPSGTRGTR